MAKKSKPVDREWYKGYEIVLMSFDWDDMFNVYWDSLKVAEFSNRSDAKKFVDDNPTPPATMNQFFTPNR